MRDNFVRISDILVLLVKLSFIMLRCDWQFFDRIVHKSFLITTVKAIKIGIELIVIAKIKSAIF